MLCVAEIESNCGVSEPFQLGSEDHIKGVILEPVLSSRSQRKLGLSSRPERRCACGLIKPRRQTIRKRCRQTDVLTNKGCADQTNTRAAAHGGRTRHAPLLAGDSPIQRDSCAPFRVPASFARHKVGTRERTTGVVETQDSNKQDSNKQTKRVETFIYCIFGPKIVEKST